MTENRLTIIGGVALFAIVIIFGGAIGFWCGWLGGWLLKLFCGEAVTNGLNMILGNITQHSFVKNDIPLFCAIMGLIAGFFKASTKKDK